MSFNSASCLDDAVSKSNDQLVKIIDATLREGNQAPKIVFTPYQCEVISQLLTMSGVSMIECGHASASKRDRDCISAVKGATHLPVLSHARAKYEDIKSVSQSGADWVGVFLGINKTSRENRHKFSDIDTIRRVLSNVIGEAKNLDLKVRYTVEDSTRTKFTELEAVIGTAIEAGADRICLSDTVGASSPKHVSELVGRIKRSFEAIPIEVHYHDDRGLAMANSLSAIEAGAEWISTSVNGLGERCGITDLAVLMANLKYMGCSTELFDLEAVQEASKYVGAVTRSFPDYRRPVTGKHAFTHSSKLHRDAVKKDEESYSWIKPEVLGRKMALQINAPLDANSLIATPITISAAELKYHRKGPGDRHVFMDRRLCEDAEQYCILRDIPHQDTVPLGHVDEHVHLCDSLWLFFGKGEGLHGLKVEVCIDGKSQILESPASVQIMAGMKHHYRVISGSGYYINHVQSGDYNSSLLESEKFIQNRKVNSSQQNRVFQEESLQS